MRMSIGYLEPLVGMNVLQMHFLLLFTTEIFSSLVIIFS